MFRLGLTTVLMTAVWMNSAVPAQEKTEKKADGRDEQAKQVAGQFATRIFGSRDLDGLMNIVGVPWYDNEGEGHKGRVVSDREQLRKELHKMLPPEKVSGEVRFEATEVLSYEKTLEKYGDKLKAEDRKLLDGVLKKDDRILQ